MKNSFLRKVEKSQTLLLNEQSKQLEQQGKTIYKFGFGQSPFLPPPPVIDRLKAAAHMKDYSPVQGVAELREAVARFHRRTDQIDIEADNVLVAPGSKILIYIILASYIKADVLVPVPSWVSYIPQAHLAGHEVIKIPMTFEMRWRLTPGALENAVKSKRDTSVPSILILNYPGNPDGLTYTLAELAELAAVARKYHILVISDEIYGLLDHVGEHKSFARYYPENTIVTGGLSKWCGAGGWRLGTALLPQSLAGDFKETLLGIASETYSCASLPVQMAACEAYRPVAEIFDYIHHQRRMLSALGMACYHRLQKAGIGVCEPQGGFYLLLDFNAICNSLSSSQQLCEKLLAETGVALLPGTAFGMEPNQLCARLAYVDFDGVKTMEESYKIDLKHSLSAEFMERHFSTLLSGIERICTWAASF